MITLALDASTYVGDVAVLDGPVVLAESSVPMKGPEHERLMPAVSDVIARAGLSVDAIDRVVCGAGPGSFTSLRIAGSIAKGIAMGIGRPLYAVPSMALILGGTALGRGRYLLAVDALRAEFYVGIYEIDEAGAIEEVAPVRIVEAAAVVAIAAEHGLRIVSPSSIEGAIQASPRAAAVGRLERSLQSHGPVDLGAWEPAYGRLAEAQVKWELANGRALTAG